MYLCFEVKSLITLFWYKEQTFRSYIREQLDQQKIITKSKVIAVGVAVAQVDIDIHYISNFQMYKCIVIYSIRWYVQKKIL